MTAVGDKNEDEEGEQYLVVQERGGFRTVMYVPVLEVRLPSGHEKEKENEKSCC